MAAREWTIHESKVHGDFVHDRWTRCATWPPYHVLSLTTFSSSPVPQPLSLSFTNVPTNVEYEKRVLKEIAMVQVSRVGLHEGPRPKKPQKLSNPGSLHCGFRSKVWKDDMVSMWHHFPVKSQPSPLKKLLLTWETNIKLKSKLGVFWTLSSLDPDSDVNPL